MTDILEPGSVQCRAYKRTSPNNKEYTLYSFFFTNYKEKIDNTQNDTIQEGDCDEHKEGDNDEHKESDEQTKSRILITRLNDFKRGITDRIKYRMMIPQYPEQTSYILTLKTIMLNNHIKFSNIVEFQQLKNNFVFRTVSNILSMCRCKFLLKIDSLTLTHSNVFLNIQLVRIFPESLDSLHVDDKLFILNKLNEVTTKNINRCNELNQFTKKQRSSKDQVRSELKKILSI